MLTALRWLTGRAAWVLISFVVIVALLWLTAGLRNTRAEAGRAAAIASALTEERARFGAIAKSEAAEARRLHDEIGSATGARLNEIETDLVRRRQAASARADPGLSIDPAVILASYRAELVEIPLLDLSISILKQRRAGLDFEAQVSDFNARVRAHEALRRSNKERLRDPFCRATPRAPGCDYIEQERATAVALRSEKQRLEARALGLRKAREATARADVLMTRATERYDALTAVQSEQAEGYLQNQAVTALRTHGLSAILIVSTAIVTPILFKLIAFFGIAPLAARAHPIRLHERGIALHASPSALSINVVLDREHELLLRSGLQSSAADIAADDLHLLDWRIPFTCLAAGLFALQRLRSERVEHATIASTDSGHRIATIDIPAGGAVTLSPRALIGIVKPRSSRLVITRPWRVLWLISWITAQFRFLVFHGPCTLIVEGRDGVIAEDAARDRMIDKRLTLGFDAHLAYGAARSASFVPYFRGQASLFTDRFGGEGRYLHALRSALPLAGGIWGRGLKGLGDAALKALGI